MLPVAVLSLSVMPAFVGAQDQGQQPAQGQGQGQRGDRGNRGGGGPGGGNFDPAQFRQRMLDNVKEQLGASDEEMQVLTPKLEKVFSTQRDVNGGFGGGMRRGGGGGGGGDQAQQTPVAKARQDLRTTLEDKNASPETIKAKVTAYRDARAKAQEDLKGAQADLKKVLTERQEAVLVSMGMLE